MIEKKGKYKKDYKTLDDIGFIGVQKTLSPSAEKKQTRKTGEAIRKWREQNSKTTSSK